ncbi:SDR family oxidoreductase [Aggregatimonas sangjinii]|uniref:SDR family oxidoreductase n=1 Tax=Aggregatimonas sangjinii TaxID=2583587 RepID=A0A5B7SPE5_9FLAO|nr:SDR family oxidoreductase [Aggregatimonas sangjinii]QCW98862.1 SDR family oxidoreductase [Aggregatimonas sangjinii]
MDLRIRDKVALVTGANRGIGFAVAKGLLQEGITVIATSRNSQNSNDFISQLSEYGDVVHHQLDVTDNGSVNACYAFAKVEFGKLDILINNAGINYDTWQNVETANLDEVRQTVETNVIGPWQTIQSFLPLLKQAENSSIVNVSSGGGSLASQTGSTPGYSISKLALNGLTLQLASKLKNDGIAVNAVCPGWVRTDMGGSGATKSPEQGAETIIWIALQKDEFVTGKFFRDKREIQW